MKLLEFGLSSVEEDFLSSEKTDEMRIKAVTHPQNNHQISSSFISKFTEFSRIYCARLARRCKDSFALIWRNHYLRDAMLLAGVNCKSQNSAGKIGITLWVILKP
jgi:hypothetical protein